MKHTLIPTFPAWNLRDKQVLVRIDANVPITHGVVTSDFKLSALTKTLDTLSAQGARITILTHRGHPDGIDQEFSTKPIADWLSRKGYCCTVLANVRFDAREYTENEAYARELAADFEYFITDAWGCLHRRQTSVTVLPTLFPPEKRSIGYLIAHEYDVLSALLKHPAQPFLLFLGGDKLETKIPLLQHFIINKLAQTIVLLPAIAHTFLQARGISVGQSLVDHALIPLAQELMQLAEKNKVQLIMPSDFVIMDNRSKKISIYEGSALPEQAISASCGPRSLELYQKLIAQAETIVYNGAMGLQGYPETYDMTNSLIQLLAQASSYRILAGGDTVALAEKQQLLDRFSFCSTGGGATLAFLGNQTLPGLALWITHASGNRAKTE